ncbi:MAG: hypothetical protein AB8G96_13330 [Phycisphaerales bacterium]
MTTRTALVLSLTLSQCLSLSAVAAAGDDDCPIEFLSSCPRWEVVESAAVPTSRDGSPSEFRARDIDDQGVNVGVMRDTVTSTMTAAVWRPGEPVTELPMPDGTTTSQAAGIDGQGRIAGDLRLSPGGGLARPLAWILDGEDLTLISPPPGASDIQVVGMDIDGTIAGQSQGPSVGMFRWNAGRFTLIVPESPLELFFPSGISDDGIIFGSTLDLATGRLMPMYAAGNEPTLLPLPAGRTSGFVTDCPSAEFIGGYTQLARGAPSQPLFWRDTEASPIAPPPNRPGSWRVRAIDDDGVVLVQGGSDGNFPTWAVVDGRSVAPLQDLCDGFPIDSTDFLVWYARAEVLVGTAVDPGTGITTVYRAVRRPGTAGDVDCDGFVGFGDVLNVLGSWSCTGERRADLNTDGAVDLADLQVILSNWGPPNGG